MELPPVFAGVDVSKARLDVALKCRTVSGGAEGANRPTLLLPAVFRRETASDMADEMRLTWERLRAPCSAKL